MVNTELLNNHIEKSGLKRIFLAKEIGISRQALAQKIDGVQDFRLSEAAKLANLLGLSKTERHNIFNL